MSSGAAPRPDRIAVEPRRDGEASLAREIAELARGGNRVVLGLATGDTPAGVYRELARLRAEEGIDFGATVTFNLDEYLGLEPGDSRSFARWTRERVALPLGIPPANGQVPATPSEPEHLVDACLAYEQAIRDAGGLDLLILGIGRNGHVAFNEPGSAKSSRTRVVELHPWTREDAAAAFGGLAAVPARAITLGIATLLDARRIRILAFGARKAEIAARALEGPVGPDVPASFLREHPDLVVRLDPEAAAALSVGGSGRDGNRN